MKTQILMLVYNSGPIIKQALESYSEADRICIYIDNKTNDDTLMHIKEYRKKSKIKVKIGYVDFENFSQARNYCIDESNVNEYEWSIFLDDSYVLHGSIAELKGLPNHMKCASIKIKCRGQEYLNKRCIRKNSNIKFINDVHEILNSSYHYPLVNCYIEDVQVKSHETRRIERINYDIKKLVDKDDDRSKYFLAGLCYQLFNLGEMSLDNAISAYIMRIECYSVHHEETFMCYMFLASLFIYKNDIHESVKNYITASLIFPKRAGECYYNIYTLTGNKYYLNKAYENRNIESVLPIMSETKENIELCYNRNKVLEELISVQQQIRFVL